MVQGPAIWDPFPVTSLLPGDTFESRLTIMAHRVGQGSIRIRVRVHLLMVADPRLIGSV